MLSDNNRTAEYTPGNPNAVFGVTFMPDDELPNKSVSQLAGFDNVVDGFSGDALKISLNDGRRSNMLTF